MSQITNPHDKYFKSSMSNLIVAKDFFAAHLPKEFRKEIDLDSLKLEKGSYIDKELKQLMSDILYSVNINDDAGYLYLLIEHQSTADRLMPFRLLEYTCRIMRRDIENGKKSLPVVIPLVLYNGSVKYPFDKDIFSLFSDKKQIELAKNCLCKPFTLIDLNEVSDDQLMGDNWSNIMMLLMKHIYSRDLIGVIESLVDKLKVLYEDISETYVWTSVSYVLTASEMEDFDDLPEILNQVNSKLGDKAMTTLERVCAKARNDGISQGISQGIDQGISQGLNKGMKKAARNFLAEGVDPKIVARATGLNFDEVIKLMKAEITEASD